MREFRHKIKSKICRLFLNLYSKYSQSPSKKLNTPKIFKTLFTRKFLDRRFWCSHKIFKIYLQERLFLQKGKVNNYNNFTYIPFSKLGKLRKNGICIREENNESRKIFFWSMSVSSVQDNHSYLEVHTEAGNRTYDHHHLTPLVYPNPCLTYDT